MTSLYYLMSYGVINLCVPVCGFRDYLVPKLRSTLFINHVLVISYIRRLLVTGYKVLNIIKCLKGYTVHGARISNVKSRKQRREPHSCKLGKSRRKGKILYLPKTKK